MNFSYLPQGVCAKEIKFEIEDGVLKNVVFVGGCKGNLAAISTLIEGMPAKDVAARLKGNLCQNQTSCADQLARALEAAENQDK